MKELVLLVLLLFNMVKTDAQRLTEKIITVGTNVFGSGITGIEYNFAYSIFNIDLDSIRQQVTLYLHDYSGNPQSRPTSGQIIAFDINTKKIKWSKLLSSHPVFSFTKDLVVQHYDTSCIVFNKETGEYIYNYNSPIWPIRYKSNIVFTPGLTGVDLKTGKEVWKREIPTFVGFGFYFPDSNNVIIIKNGINKINMQTGSGWHIDGQTTVAYEAQKVVYHMIQSDPVLEQDKMYLALYGKVICADTAGRIVWESKIAEGESSTSELIHLKQSNTLLLINYGYARVMYAGAPNKKIFSGKYGSRELKYNLIRYGTPFVEALDITTGKKKFHTVFEKWNIKNLGLLNDEKILIGNNRQFTEVDLKTGSALPAIDITEQLSSYLYPVDGTQIFPSDNNNDFKTFKQLYPEHYFLQNDSGSLVVLNKGIEEATFFPSDKWQKKICEKNNVTFFKSKNNLTFVKNNKKLATIKATKVFLLDNTLIDIDDNSCRLIDLKQILNL